MKSVPQSAVLGLLALVLFLGFVPSACTVSQPFFGPGFDAELGVLVDGPQDEVFLSVTHLVLGPDLRGPFTVHRERVLASLESREGYLGSSTRTTWIGDQLWILTVWEDQASLREYQSSDVHQDALDVTTPALCERRSFSTALPRSEVPLGWGEALRRLRESGADQDGEELPTPALFQ